MDYRMFQRKYLLGCLGKVGKVSATVGNRVTTRQSFYSHSFLFFSVSFNQSLVFPSRLCSQAFQHILDIVGLSQAEVWRSFKFNSHCYSFMKTNLRIIKAYQNTLGFVGNNYLTHYITEVHYAYKTEIKIIAEKKLVYISTRARNFSLHHPVTTTPTPNPLSYRHCWKANFEIFSIIANRYCRRNARFPVHSSPYRKLQKFVARVLICPGKINANYCGEIVTSSSVLDHRVGIWRLLGLKLKLRMFGPYSVRGGGGSWGFFNNSQTFWANSWNLANFL